MRPYIVYFVNLIFFCTLGASSHAAECGTGMTDNGNGTVTDSSTGLTWKQCLEGQTVVQGSSPSCTGTASKPDWSGALGLDVDNDPWRVPNIKELQSIVEYTGYDPAINITCFPTPDGVSVPVWTSSPVASDLNNSWIIDFRSGLISNQVPQSTADFLYVRLVCDGDSVACQP